MSGLSALREGVSPSGGSSPSQAVYLGICLARLGRKDEALKAFTLALEIDPDYEPAMVNMAIVEQLPEGEALTAREVRRIEYYKDYPLQNKSYIQSLLDTPEKSMENVNRLGFTDNPIK